MLVRYSYVSIYIRSHITSDFIQNEKSILGTIQMLFQNISSNINLQILDTHDL